MWAPGPCEEDRSRALFMVVGQPDISITPVADDKVRVEIHGVDVYDPTPAAPS